MLLTAMLLTAMLLTLPALLRRFGTFSLANWFGSRCVAARGQGLISNPQLFGQGSNGYSATILDTHGGRPGLGHR